MANDDGTLTCAHDGCQCRVADDETHAKDEQGQIYCSEDCLDGSGCDHQGCNCGSS